MDLAEVKDVWDKAYPRPGLSKKGSEAIDWLIAEVERLTAENEKFRDVLADLSGGGEKHCDGCACSERIASMALAETVRR